MRFIAGTWIALVALVFAVTARGPSKERVFAHVLMARKARSSGQVAQALGRRKTDGMVRRLLAELAAEGRARRDPTGWVALFPRRRR